MTDLKKHIIVKVDNVHWSINGSIRKRLDHQTQNTDYYYFNASGNLKACGTDMQISVYGYNSANTRTYKVNLFNASQWVNDQPQPIQPMVQSAMFYPNTYINFTQAGEYTKHYYNGTERICSRLGEQQIPISVENDQELLNYQHDTKEILRNAIGQHLYDEPTDMQEGDVFHLEYLQVTGDNNAVYYYHPNYLGSTSFVTDMQQSVVQSFLYAPFGEITTEYNVNFGNNVIPKYSFNAKELDEETGFYYYEARYYNPPTFISRDPLMSEKPWLTPYHYCSNNPIGRVDPSGMFDDEAKANKYHQRAVKKYGSERVGNVYNAGTSEKPNYQFMIYDKGKEKNKQWTSINEDGIHVHSHKGNPISERKDYRNYKHSQGNGILTVFSWKKKLGGIFGVAKNGQGQETRIGTGPMVDLSSFTDNMPSPMYFGDVWKKQTTDILPPVNENEQMIQDGWMFEYYLSPISGAHNKKTS